jgi:hypothetical protein
MTGGKHRLKAELQRKTPPIAANPQPPKLYSWQRVFHPSTVWQSCEIPGKIVTRKPFDLDASPAPLAAG